MKNDGELKRKLISLIITGFVLVVGILKNDILFNNQKYINKSNVIAMVSSHEYNLEEDVVSFINQNNEIFNFYANAFGISLNDLKEAIINDNIESRLNPFDIGNTNKFYETLDKNLIDYLFNLKKNNSKLFKQTYVNGNTYSKDYIYGLIDYYSTIYTNVDKDVLSSIIFIETGNLNSKYMLKYNNIYGGMGSKGLLKYNNIEYGTLVYVKMMSERYYAKGLTTIESIAKKYNPGNKSWVGKVKKYANKFNNDEKIYNINSLINLK